MGIVEKAYSLLYPDKDFPYIVDLNYSGKFDGFNANAKMRGNHIKISMSKKWRGISEDIKIGLIQELITSLHKSKKDTPNMRMYNNFIKNLTKFAERTKSDPALEASYDRVNDNYFYGLIDKPNLRWGSHSTTTLGSYKFQTDTITISKIFRESPLEILDYIMYHEMLHKKVQFEKKNGRTRYHTPEFRKQEKAYPNSELIEKELSRITRKHRFKKTFGFLGF